MSKLLDLLWRILRPIGSLILRALLALLLLVIGAGVLFTFSRSAMYLFAPQIDSFYSSDRVPLTDGVFTAIDPTYANPTAFDTGDHAMLSIVVNAIRPEDRTATLTIQAALGDQLQQSLVDTVTGESILEQTYPVAIVKPKYADLTAYVNFDGFDPAFEVQVPITLRDLIEPSSTFQPFEFHFFTTTEVISVPVTWLQQHFPRDVLSLSANVRLTLPIYVETSKLYSCLKVQTPPCPSPFPKLAVEVQIWNSSAFIGWQGTVNQEEQSNQQAGALGAVSVQLSFVREQFLVFYTMGIALVPVVLFGLLVYTMVPSRKRRKADEADPPGLRQNFVLSLAATMFTVLPLRAVLVPQQITTVTAIDLLLGAELLLLLWLGVLDLLLHILRDPNQTSRT